MRCLDCKKADRLAPCEVHNPPQARICKDCCIGKFSGHRCPWWELCWR